jgi:hypothetical protein
MSEKKYVIRHKKWNAPLSKYKAQSKSNGVYEQARMTVTFSWDKAIRFSSREDAFFYLDQKKLKGYKQVNQWVPIKETLLWKRIKKKPLRQLHTGKWLIKNPNKKP